MKAKTKKRGWLTIAIVLIAVSGFLVYQYAYLVYQDYDYYTYYDDIHALQIANPVFVNGVKVGEVSQIKLNGGEKVRVTLSIDKKTQLHKGTVAILASNSLRGDKMIFLEQGQGSEVLSHKAVITGKYDTTVMDMTDQVSPIIESAKYILNTADKNFTTFNRKVDNGLVEKTQKDIRRIEQRMTRYHTQLGELEKNTAKIISTISNMKTQAQAINGKRQELNKTIKTAENATEEWSNKNIAPYLDTIEGNINAVRQQVSEIENNTTVKKALENSQTYNDATKKSAELNNSLREMKKN